MSKKKGIIRLVVLLAVNAFVVYTAVSGLGSDRSGSLNDISLGLDLIQLKHRFILRDLTVLR